MTLVRFDPVREINSLQSDFNRVFDRFFDYGTATNGGRRWVPAMDLSETGDHLILKADLPGMTEEDINIEVKGRALTISGERRDEKRTDEKGFHRVERSFGTFSRALGLPEGIDPDAVTAKFAHGVLEVTIPKPAETKATRVQIEAGEAPKSIEGAATEK